MPKPSLRVEVTQTAKVDLNISAQARQMLKARTDEHARLAKEIKDREARQKRIRDEVQDIALREDQGEALLEGFSIDGHKVKLVEGETESLDLDLLKRTFGLTEADIQSCRVTKANKPYVKITPPAAKKEEQ